MMARRVPLGFRSSWEEVWLRPYTGWRPAIDWSRQMYGMEPNRIPADSALRLDYLARTVTFTEFEMDDQGRVRVEGEDAVTRQVTVQMESPPAAWPFDPTDILLDEKWWPRGS